MLYSLCLIDETMVLEQGTNKGSYNNTCFSCSGHLLDSIDPHFQLLTVPIVPAFLDPEKKGEKRAATYRYQVLGRNGNSTILLSIDILFWALEYYENKTALLKKNIERR